MRALHQNCLHQMLLLRGVMMMLLMMRMTTLTMIVWSWDDGKAWVPICPRREAVDALPPLLLLTHYLISLHSVAARCVLLVLRVLFPFRCCCRTFCLFFFYLFPGVGRSHAGNDDSDIAARVVCGVCPYMLTAESKDQEAAPTMVLSRARGGYTLGKERGWW